VAVGAPTVLGRNPLNTGWSEPFAADP